MECIYGPTGFWSFSDPGSGTEFADVYDLYPGLSAMPAQTLDPNGGYGANFFGSFQDSGGGGVGGSGNPPADPFGTPENRSIEAPPYQNRLSVIQPIPYADTEVLKKPVIKKESSIR